MEFFDSYVGDAADFDDINTIVYVNDAINDDFIVCVEYAQQFVSFLRNQKHKGYPYY